MKITNIPELPLSQKVATEIQGLITSEELKPGEQLPNEFELADRLKVSRSTVREAIKFLAARNVVTIKRGRGTFVSERPGLTEDPLGLDFVTDKKKLSRDLMEVRWIIEPEIAGLAAKNATNEQVEKMELLCLEIEELIKHDENHAEKDIELHSLLAQASGNVVVLNFIPIIEKAISLFIDLTNRSLKMETIISHKEIVGAIKIGDSESAKKAMQRHLIYNKEKLGI